MVAEISAAFAATTSMRAFAGSAATWRNSSPGAAICARFPATANKFSAAFAAPNVANAKLKPTAIRDNFMEHFLFKAITTKV